MGAFENFSRKKSQRKFTVSIASKFLFIIILWFPASISQMYPSGVLQKFNTEWLTTGKPEPAGGTRLCRVVYLGLGNAAAIRTSPIHRLCPGCQWIDAVRRMIKFVSIIQL